MLRPRIGKLQVPQPLRGYLNPTTLDTWAACNVPKVGYSEAMNASPNWDTQSPRDTILAMGRERGLHNRKAISDASGIPRSSFYRNIDQPRKFDVDHFGGLAEALGVTVDDLYSRVVK